MVNSNSNSSKIILNNGYIIKLLHENILHYNYLVMKNKRNING